MCSYQNFASIYLLDFSDAVQVAMTDRRAYVGGAGHGVRTRALEIDIVG